MKAYPPHPGPRNFHWDKTRVPTNSLFELGTVVRSTYLQMLERGVQVLLINVAFEEGFKFDS
jgi:hypothetical protein